MSKSGGKQAVPSDQRLEDFVADILDEEGHEKVDASRFFAEQGKGRPIYARRCNAGKDVYGKQRRVDIILYHPRLHPDCLVIQCKWQVSSGSVEQKYPFEVLSIKQNECDTIIILDGEGYSSGAKQWLIEQAGKGRKLRHVLTQGKFTEMANKSKFSNDTQAALKKSLPSGK